MQRVLVISSQPLFGQGLESLLCQEKALEVVGRETDVDQAIERIKELRPDVVIVDNCHPTCAPTPTIIRILGKGLRVKIIGLNLENSTLCIYHGEQRVVQEVEDLLRAIEQSSAP
jgi:DNA-binding NarL/FixJ family response regulator